MRRYKFRRRPHRIRKRKSILKSRFFRNLIFFLAILGSGVYFFIFSDFFQVKDIIITGQEGILVENIESIVRGEAGNIFLLNTKKMKEALLQKFPQIAELEIKKSFPNVLNLALAERKEIGIFCDETSCFLLDGEGVVFAPAPEESALPRFRNKNFVKELTLGDKVFDKEILEAILELNGKLTNNLGIFTDEFLLVSQERLNARTLEGWEIYFNLKKDLDWQITSLATILEKRIPPQKRSKLEYIDLRFNKIFVYPQVQR